jgi:hypothetical protein
VTGRRADLDEGFPEEQGHSQIDDAGAQYESRRSCEQKKDHSRSAVAYRLVDHDGYQSGATRKFKSIARTDGRIDSIVPRKTLEFWRRF